MGAWPIMFVGLLARVSIPAAVLTRSEVVTQGLIGEGFVALSMPTLVTRHRYLDGVSDATAVASPAFWVWYGWGYVKEAHNFSLSQSQSCLSRDTVTPHSTQVGQASIAASVNTKLHTGHSFCRLVVLQDSQPEQLRKCFCSAVIKTHPIAWG
jgi:hypothetical protein